MQMFASPMPDSAGRPILVTGSHRSGSTWIGATLALAPDAGYIPEPFNRMCRPGVCRAGFRHTFTRLTAENAASYGTALADTLAWRYSLRAELGRLASAHDLGRMLRDAAYFQAMRLRRARPVMKDPIALFSAEWLAATFGMHVVVVIRHPAAFAASLRSAGWVRFPFANLRDQPGLMQDRLAPFAAAVEAAAVSPPDEIDSAILLWNIFHHEIARYRADHPDWIFLRHEDLSADPAAGFRALFAALGLAFTPAVARGLQGLSSDRADGVAARTRRLASRVTRIRPTGWLERDSRRTIHAWKTRLEPGEIARIRRGTEPLAARFYASEEW
jgi:LPS sulfotransferase NodH